MIEFNDRRPKPDTKVRLTARQRELAKSYGIGEPDARGELTLTRDGYRKALSASYDMMTFSQEWGKERRGDVTSAKNLTNKLFGAVSEAVRDNCPHCQSRGCPECLGTGRRL
jgi:hypothetical protein